MKLKHLLITSLALAGAAFSPPSAQAQVQVSYNSDDLFLGFRKTGASFDYLVNIGQASIYRDFAGTSFTLAIGNILPDLNAAFGPGWASDPNVFWSVSGSSGLAAVGIDVSRTLYATREELTFGIQSGLWNRGSSTTQGTPNSKMGALAQAYLQVAGTPNNSTANSNFAILQDPNATNSYASYQPGGTVTNSGPAPGTGFAYFNPSIEGSFANGAAGSQLDLVRLVPGATTVGEFVGTFTITNGGAVAFNNNVVPEPGSFAIVAAGTALLGLVRRRRSVHA